MINENEERTILVEIRKNSILSNKTLSETKVKTHTGATLKAYKRNGKWNFNINKQTVIKPEDLVFATGNSKAKKLFIKVAEGTLKTVY